MPISAVDAVNPAFQHAKQQLLHPFRFGQWARLAFVGLLAGEAGSGGGCNSNFRLPSSHQHGGSQHFLSGTSLPHFAQHPALYAGVIAWTVVIGLALIVGFLYISSV